MSNILPFIAAAPTALNEARIEFMYSVLAGLPATRQKRLIVEAALPDVGFLTAMQAEMLISSLGLEAA